MAESFLESIGTAELIKLKYNEGYNAGYSAGQNDLTVSSGGIRIPPYGSAASLGQLLWKSNEFAGPKNAPVAHLVLMMYGHGYQSSMQTRQSHVPFDGANQITIHTGVYGPSPSDYRIVISRNHSFYRVYIYADNNLSSSENIVTGSYLIIDQDP